MARFGQAPKASKPPQQLSKALEPHNPPQQLSKACRLLGHGTSLGPTSCFYWASKLLCGTFWAGAKSLKTSAAAFEGLRTSHPSAAAQQLSKVSHLLGHGTSLGPTSCFYWASKLPCGPTSCFYWASKLPCGTFWAGPKTLKTSAAAFERLWQSYTNSWAIYIPLFVVKYPLYKAIYTPFEWFNKPRCKSTR